MPSDSYAGPDVSHERVPVVSRTEFRGGISEPQGHRVFCVFASSGGGGFDLFDGLRGGLVRLERDRSWSVRQDMRAVPVELRIESFEHAPAVDRCK